jgi:hypothetical protein
MANCWPYTAPYSPQNGRHQTFANHHVGVYARISRRLRTPVFMRVCGRRASTFAWKMVVAGKYAAIHFSALPMGHSCRQMPATMSAKFARGFGATRSLLLRADVAGEMVALAPDVLRRLDQYVLGGRCDSRFDLGAIS